MRLTERQRAATACLTALGSLLTAACSLMELDRVDAGSCDPELGTAACAELNLRYHTAGKCVAYQCSADRNGCEARPRDEDNDGFPNADTCTASEVGDRKLDCNDHSSASGPDRPELCDGEDNDCDGDIDEGVLVDADDSTMLIAIGEAQQALDPNEAHQFAVSTGAAATWFTFTRTSPRVNANASWAVNLAEMPPHVREAAFFDPMSNSDECPGRGIELAKCDVRDLAVSPLAAAGEPDAVVAIARNGVNCGSGQARIALGVSAADQLQLLQQTSPQSTDLGRGVEADCPDAGVVSPVIAALASSPEPQAAALWLETRTPSLDASCPMLAAPATVKALGIRVSRDLATREPELLAAHGGEPELLDRETSSSARPALIAWEGDLSAGYLAGYAGADGSLALQSMAALAAEPAANDALLGASQSCTLAPAGDGHVSYVTLASSPAHDPGSVEVAALFQAGCGPTSSLQLAIMSLDTTSDPSPTPIFPAAHIIGPSIVSGHGPDTIIAGPAALAFEPRSGSWVAAWIEHGATSDVLRGARFRLVDGNLKRVSSLKLAEAQPGALVSPVAFATGDGLSWAVMNQFTAQLTLGGKFCSVQ